MNEITHPSRQQILDFALGRLSEADSLAIESHLAQCSSCMKVLEESPDDTCIQIIRKNLEEKPGKTIVGDGSGSASFRVSQNNDTGEYTPHPVALQSLRRDDFHAGDVFSDRYTLITRIGEGGMGEVWEAQQTQPVQRQVAIKLIKAGQDSKSVVQRFELERQALALMNHPNIARVYDAGVSAERQPYFVMELVNGLPLNKFCDENRLGIPERLELFIPICHAVQHAHQKGIVHRDLKPANILVSMIDGKPVPKVIDFGVAKALNTKLTEETLATNVGAVIGTLEYMAPEQAGGDSVDIDTRADVYSLGVILYELLTGLRPFDPRRLRRAMIVEIIRIVQQEEPSKPSTRLSTDESLPSLAATRDIEPKKLAAILRGELDWIVMKCLEKQRDRRYETPNSLARDVQRYLAHEAVEARPPSLGYQFNKFVRRHRGAVWAAGLITLSLCLAVIGTTWGMVRAEEKKLEAEKAWKAEAERATAEAAAKKLAQKRLTQVEKSNSILASVFKQLDPREVIRAERPLQAILVEKIQQAVEATQSDAISDPLVSASTQTLLGKSLIGLAEPSKAIPILEKATALRRQQLGASHPETIESANNLAQAWFDAGKREAAVSQMKETLALSEKHLGLEDQHTLIARDNLGSAYSEMGKFREAIPLLQITYEQRKKLMGPEHETTLKSLNNLAMAYQACGQHTSALPLLEESLKLSEQQSPNHPDRFSAMNNLAMGYFFLGRINQAIPLFEKTLELRRAKLGPEHMDTLGSMNNLASMYRSMGKADLAAPLFEEVVSRLRAKWGSDHSRTLTAANNLASTYDLAGKTSQAITILEDTVQRRKQKLGVEHPDTIASMNNLAIIQLKAKKYPEAEKGFRDILAVRQKKEPNAWGVFNTTSLLGESLLMQKRYAEAEPLLLTGYQGMKERQPQTPAAMKNRLSQTLDRLIQLFEETHRPDAVKQWKEEKKNLDQPGARNIEPLLY